LIDDKPWTLSSTARFKSCCGYLYMPVRKELCSGIQLIETPLGECIQISSQ
jgi:hypothetical protein